MSQFPVISPVSNIHPDQTFGEKPPTTDTDGDGIPDVHENIFEEWINFSAVDGRLVTMKVWIKVHPRMLISILIVTV